MLHEGYGRVPSAILVFVIGYPGEGDNQVLPGSRYSTDMATAGGVWEVPGRTAAGHVPAGRKRKEENDEQI